MLYIYIYIYNLLLNTPLRSTPPTPSSLKHADVRPAELAPRVNPSFAINLTIYRGRRYRVA